MSTGAGSGGRPPRFRQRSLRPLGQRVRRLLLRRLGHRFVHRHRVLRLRIGGRSFKRIRFGDAWLASRAAAGLEHFRGAGVLPELEARFDDELLVEFVEGRPLARFDAGVAEPMAAFFARIHEGGASRSSPAASGDLARARRDLAFLHDVGVLGTGDRESLGRALERLAPPELWVGWDYTDAVPKNLVQRPDGSLAGVDVECLIPEGLVGIGIAKSLARGDAGYRDRFWPAFQRLCSLDLAAAFPFVELCFQLRWLKNRCLKGSRIDASGLLRYGRSADESGTGRD